jgi:hypothetical protein
MFGFIASLLTGTAPGGTAASIYETSKANKAARKAAEVDRKIEARRRTREQAATLREAQIARAQAVAAGVNTGVTESSGLQGQVASIQSQASSNIAYSNQVQTGMDVVGMYQNKSAAASQRASNWDALAKISMQASSMGT